VTGDVFFYEQLNGPGTLFRATGHTAGPWSPDAQHGGPPSALLGRAIERERPREDMMLARVAVEILGPVPIGELEVRCEVTRPGRSVEQVTATLSAGGRDRMTAVAWRILRTQSQTPAAAAPAVPAATDVDPGPGYLAAVEWRPVTGVFWEPGPCTMWARLRGAVVAGEEPSPLQRVLAAADSGNGVSSTLPMAEAYFINPELTVHLHREAVGEWILIDAVTTISAGGVGLATSVLSDTTGELGRGAQALLVGPRPSASRPPAAGLQGQA